MLDGPGSATSSNERGWLAGRRGLLTTAVAGAAMLAAAQMVSLTNTHGSDALAAVHASDAMEQTARAVIELGRRRANASSAMPLVDRTSPETTVRSYWSMRDYLALSRQAVSEHVAQIDREIGSPMHALLGAAARAPRHPPSAEHVRYERQIESVSSAGGTRMEVLARVRNVTALQHAVVLSQDQFAARQQGARFRYVLDKAPTGWVIESVWSQGPWASQDAWHQQLPVESQPGRYAFYDAEMGG